MAKYCQTHDCRKCKQCKTKDVRKFNADAKKATVHENKKLRG